MDAVIVVVVFLACSRPAWPLPPCEPTSASSSCGSQSELADPSGSCFSRPRNCCFSRSWLCSSAALWRTSAASRACCRRCSASKKSSSACLRCSCRSMRRRSGVSSCVTLAVLKSGPSAPRAGIHPVAAASPANAKSTPTTAAAELQQVRRLQAQHRPAWPMPSSWDSRQQTRRSWECSACCDCSVGASTSCFSASDIDTSVAVPGSQDCSGSSRKSSDEHIIVRGDTLGACVCVSLSKAASSTGDLYGVRARRPAARTRAHFMTDESCTMARPNHAGTHLTAHNPGITF
mmetsp:Transcript_117117/g.326277  ORF Transcript_117117/g.326277 Transcript_117117/m.326277 type:complete len:290 (+) Transcript_117117:902-1771(+)